MDCETQNMISNDSGFVGQSRLKPYIVVTDWWYKDIIHLLIQLRAMARGWSGEPPNLELAQLLIESDLLDGGGIGLSQHRLPLKYKWLWRLKWWFKRIRRAIWYRDRYKLDWYWMNQDV